MGRKLCKILTETEADKIVDDFVTFLFTFIFQFFLKQNFYSWKIILNYFKLYLNFDNLELIMFYAIDMAFHEEINIV